MPRLTVPKRYREGVFKISQLDDRTVQAIRSGLNRMTAPPESPTKAAVEAVTSLSQTNTADFLKIAEALTALYDVRAGKDVSVEEFANDICDAMISLDEPQWRLSEDKRDEFRDKLLALLSADAFAVISKAHDLQTDDERTFCSARVLTDLRPVFGTNVEEGPKGLVVVHLLKLVFHQSSNRQHDEFYVSLDSDDLQTLKRVIERAEAKGKVMRSSVQHLPFFGPNGTKE